MMWKGRLIVGGKDPKTPDLTNLMSLKPLNLKPHEPEPLKPFTLNPPSPKQDSIPSASEGTSHGWIITTLPETNMETQKGPYKD